MNTIVPAGVHVWIVLLKAVRAISNVSRADVQKCGLGESDFRVLEVLLHKGAQPVNAIGPKVDLTPGSISVAVDRLYDRGLVSRVEDTEDRRIRIVDLTPAGRELIEPVFKHHAESMEQVVNVLSANERLELERLLKKIGFNAERLSSSQ